MPIQDPLGATVPAPSDAADLPLWVRTLSLTSPPIVRVNSRTHANSMRAAYEQACVEVGVQPVPLFVWNGQLENLERWNGSDWEYLAGRQHGATVQLSRSALAAGGTPWLLNATGFTRASAGWTIANNRVVIPATGMYAVTVNVNVSGSASTLGRVFGQLAIGGTSLQMRAGTAYNEDNYTWSIAAWPMSAGNQLTVTHYHESGGARDVTASMNIVMSNSPNWVTF